MIRRSSRGTLQASSACNVIPLRGGGGGEALTLVSCDEYKDIYIYVGIITT